jgi:hypothetical protein
VLPEVPLQSLIAEPLTAVLLLELGAFEAALFGPQSAAWLRPGLDPAGVPLLVCAMAAVLSVKAAADAIVRMRRFIRFPPLVPQTTCRAAICIRHSSQPAERDVRSQ